MKVFLVLLAVILAGVMLLLSTDASARFNAKVSDPLGLGTTENTLPPIDIRDDDLLGQHADFIGSDFEWQSESQTIALASMRTKSPGFSVTATREGLIGGRTANGRTIRRSDEFVALPSREALGKIVQLTYNGRTIEVPVWDVGPHNINDDYWNHSGVPMAEKGLRDKAMARYGKPKNPAGIDISDGAWAKLGLTHKVGMVEVTWRFKP